MVTVEQYRYAQQPLNPHGAAQALLTSFKSHSRSDSTCCEKCDTSLQQSDGDGATR